MKLPIHRIIPFSNVEGIGNRTSIFVQGCNINCLYCHNSETIPKDFNGVHLFTVEELIKEIKANMPFIRGITVSGGEPTLYHKFLIDLFNEAHKMGLTCYIDSNGFFDKNQINDLIQVTDKFLFDVKGIGKSLNKLCFSNFLLENLNSVKMKSERFTISQEHISNLKYLLSLNKIEEVRLVYLKGYYNEEKVIEVIANELKNYPDIPLKIIRVHARGLTPSRAKALKGHIPSKLDVEKLNKLAYSKGIQQINYIL